jgi:hypothetical protein
VGNVFSKVDGLTLMNMQNSRISRNTFTDSKSIWANNCNQTQILYNNMFNTQISLGEQGAGNLIAANTITNSSAAISTVANSTIKYNQIINCQTAINQASNCEVTQNNIENCDTAFSYAENNVIYQNNIVGCAKLVQGQYTYHSVYPMANNTWSRDGVGNFWSSYNGSGTVFVLDENNIDSHPLTSEVKIEVPQDLDGQTLALDQTLLLVAAVAAVAVAAIVVILLAKRKRRSTQA